MEDGNDTSHFYSRLIISTMVFLLISVVLYLINDTNSFNIIMIFSSLFVISSIILASYTGVNYFKLMSQRMNLIISSVVFFIVLGTFIFLYLIKEPAVMSYIAIILTPIILLIGIVGLAIFYYMARNYIRYQNDTWVGLIINIIFFIPCMVLDFFQYIKSEMNSTTNVIYYLFITQIILILLYVIVPAFINNIALVNTDEQIDNDPLNIEQKLKTLSDGSMQLINAPIALRNEYVVTPTINETFVSGQNRKKHAGNFVEKFDSSTPVSNINQTGSQIDADTEKTVSDINNTGTQIGQGSAQTGTQIGQGAAQTGTQIGQGSAQTGSQIGQGAGQTGTQIGEGAAQTGTQIGQGAAQPGRQLGQGVVQTTTNLVSQILDNLDYLNPLSKQTRNNTLDQVIYDSGENKKNYSISFWFYYNVHSSSNIAYSRETNIIDYGNGIPKVSFVNKENNNNKKNIRVYFTNNQNTNNRSYDIEVLPQRWNQFVFNYTSTQADLFINGKLIHTYKFDNNQKQPIVNLTNSIVIGDKIGLDGSVKDLRMYKSPRTKQEIITSYNLIQKKNEEDENNLLE